MVKIKINKDFEEVNGTILNVCDSSITIRLSMNECHTYPCGRIIEIIHNEFRDKYSLSDKLKDVYVTLKLIPINKCKYKSGKW